MKINGSLVFDASSASEIQNLRVEKLSATPTWTSADAGRLIYITGTGALYYGGSSAWLTLATGGNAAALQTEVDNLEAAIGAAVTTSGIFDETAFTGFTNVTSPTSITNVLAQLDSAISGKDALAELVDVAITAPADNQLLQYNSTLSKWENTTIGSGSGVQAWDAGLDNLAALAGTGIVVETADGVFANRSLVQPAAGITITNADGVSGNPTFALANDLAALEGLTTTGYIIRTGDGTMVTRPITGTSGRIVVTNGDGVASDTNVDLATVTPGTGGTFQKFSVDSYGRISAVDNVVAADITSLVDSTYVNVSGDTMNSGANLTFAGGGTVMGLPSPTNDTDAANKAYVDAIAAGLTWKNAVHVLSTTNVPLTGTGTAPLVVDSHTVLNGERVLLTGQTTGTENGIYVYAESGANYTLTRATDADTYQELNGAAVFVQVGTLYGDTGWVQTATLTSFAGQTWSQFSGSSVYSWGVGLSISGNTVNINVGAGIAELPTDEVGIDLYDAANGALILTSDGSTRVTTSPSQLYLLLDGAGGLAQTSAGLKISAAGVTNAMLANSTLTLNGDTGTDTIALGETLLVAGDSVQGISTAVTANTITVSGVDASTTQKGVASFDTNHFSVTAGAVSLAASLDDLTNVSTADAAATNSLLQKSAGDWVAVSPATVAGTMLLGDLSDVGTATPTDGDVLVGNGSSWNNQKVYYLHTEASAATTWTVTHNIGQKYCVVTVVDDTDNVVIPQSIVFDSTNQLTVTFNTAVAGKVVVMGIA